MAQVKKLSVATVCGKIDLKKLIAADEKGESLPLMTVLGNAVGVKSGSSTYGEWTSLLGMFEATDIGTGEVSAAATLFLPDVALIPIQVALAQEGTRGVEFAITVSARYAPDSKGVPYEYTWEPLLPPDANDPITRIKARLAALPAPAGFAQVGADKKPEPAPAPAAPEPAKPTGKSRK